MPRLIRRNHGAGHSYLLDDKKAIGATTALSAGYPLQLKQWASDQAANYAVEHWEELADLPMTKKLDRIRYAHKDTLKKAAVRGTRVHGYGELLVRGEPAEIPEEYLGPATAYARFLDAWHIEPVAVETPLAHTQWGYAGTADLWATIGTRDQATALIDLKTGASVYETVALQLAAYRYADLWQPDGPDSEETSVLEVDLVYVAHILPDAVRLLPVRAGLDEHRQFLYVLQTARWIAAHGWRGDDPVVGEAEYQEAVA